MIRGVKFCGGCNPLYDRRQKLEEIKKANPDDEFEYASADRHYEQLLVICGCRTCCASYDDLSYDKVVIIRDADDK